MLEIKDLVKIYPRPVAALQGVEDAYLLLAQADGQGDTGRNEEAGGAAGAHTDNAHSEAATATTL